MKTCWAIGQYEDPIAIVETEADAEEIFMDLVMEEQYFHCISSINLGGFSIKECKQKEWIWLGDFDYFLIPVCNLL